MTDETITATTTPQTPVTPEASTAAPSTPAPADDFDDNLIPEASRENFRKYRESQKSKYGDLEKRHGETEAKYTEIQNKLNEETRRRMEFEARAAEQEARQKAAQNQSTDAGPMPDYKTFSTVEEFRDALLKWAKQVGANEYRESQTKQQQEQAAAAERQKMELEGNKMRAKYPDYDQVLRPIIGVANQIPVLVQYTKEFGGEMLYHLGKNPAVLEGLMKMQPFAAGQELLRIQAALSAPLTKAVTQAPEPMKPVNTGNDSSVKGILDLVKKEDASDYVARENRKLLRKNKAD